MLKAIKFVAMAAIAIGALASPALAQSGGGSSALITFSGAFGIGLAMLGAAAGISKIGAAAVESMARQPEKAKDIQGAMIIAAALIEGATFFAILMAWLGGSN